MIEINLTPNVKQELIRAQRSRALVVSGAILVSIIAGAIVACLAVFVFGGQKIIIDSQQGAIKEQDKKLHAASGLKETLTIQNQLKQLAALHDEKAIVSRFGSVLEPIKPPAPNIVKYSKISLDTEEGIIKIDAQAEGGYPAFETFKKTLADTTFTYTSQGSKDSQQAKLAETESIRESDLSYGKDETDKTVLRFTITFTYSPELLARQSTNVKVKGPAKTNATDSFLGLPPDLFTTKAKDQETP